MKPTQRSDKRMILRCSLRTLLCLLLAATVRLQLAAKGTGITAVRATDFLNSIGVNSAIAARGESLQKTIECARYLGMHWFRSGIEDNVPIQQLIDLHQQTGVRFSWSPGSGGADLAKLINTAKQLAPAGALLAFEGPNEPNNWGITYQSQPEDRKQTWLPVARLQRDLYNAVKSDFVLHNYPVWSTSETGAETDNVGLQFLTIPTGAGTLLPDGTRYADYANGHNYMYHPGWPGLHDNETWVAADPTSACKLDGLYGNYGLTWGHKYPGYSEAILLTLPRVTTETGTTVEGLLTEHIQALNYLTVYLDQFKRGWRYTAIYLLRDRTDENGNQTFGFFKPDYTPRQAAVYLHTLTTILADDRSIPAPGHLDYSIPNQPATLHDLLLQKSDGTFELVVWDERVSGSDSIVVHLGNTYQSVKVYDPTIGPAPIHSHPNIAALRVTLSDHPVIIEIPAGAIQVQR